MYTLDKKNVWYSVVHLNIFTNWVLRNADGKYYKILADSENLIRYIFVVNTTNNYHKTATTNWGAWVGRLIFGVVYI